MEYCQHAEQAPKVTSEPQVFYNWFWVGRAEVPSDPLT